MVSYYLAARSALHKIQQDGAAALISSLLVRVSSSRASKFDTEFGTDTEAIVPLWQLDTKSRNLVNAVRYQSADPDFVKEAIEALKIDFRQFVYIDLGSGKGTLLVASEFPFAKIVGVDRFPGILLWKGFQRFEKGIVADHVAQHAEYGCALASRERP